MDVGLIARCTGVPDTFNPYSSPFLVLSPNRVALSEASVDPSLTVGAAATTVPSSSGAAVSTLTCDEMQSGCDESAPASALSHGGLYVPHAGGTSVAHVLLDGMGASAAPASTSRVNGAIVGIHASAAPASATPVGSSDLTAARAITFSTPYDAAQMGLATPLGSSQHAQSGAFVENADDWMQHELAVNAASLSQCGGGARLSTAHGPGSTASRRQDPLPTYDLDFSNGGPLDVAADLAYLLAAEDDKDVLITDVTHDAATATSSTAAQLEEITRW